MWEKKARVASLSWALDWSGSNLQLGGTISFGKSTLGAFMRFAALLAGVLAVAPLAAQRPVPSGGQWLIDRSAHADNIQLDLRYGEAGHSSNWGRAVTLSDLAGLSAADMDGAGTTVHFRIVRAAGTLACDGWFSHGQGSGHFTTGPPMGSSSR
jgi:hypothetical protein